MNNLINPDEGSQRRLGTAAFASEESIAGLSFKEGDFWLGRAVDDRALGINDDRHILLVAGSRSGKGRTTIVPGLINWQGSVVVIDPKGENAALTAARRGSGSRHAKGMGQKVYVLDPFGEVRSLEAGLKATFNPLDVLSAYNNESVDEAARIAAAIVVPNPQAKDPYFDDQARYLLRSIILHVVSSPNYEDRRNLVTVRKLLLAGDTEALGMIDQKDDPNPVSAFELLFQDMINNAHFRGVVSTAGSAFLGLHGGDGWRSVSSTAISHTNFLDSPDMQEVLRETTPGLRLSDLKTDPKGVSIYISLPQRYMADHFRWLRMMTTLVVTEMEKTRGAPKAGHPVLMCLDEFAGLKRMEVIENAAAQIAGFGVKLLIVVQNLVQLKSVYQDNWETFIGNAGTKLFFGVEDNFTREYLSKQLGETEISRTTSSSSESRGVSYSETSGRSSSVSDSTGSNSSFSSTTSHSSPGGYWGAQASSSVSYSSSFGSNSGRSVSEGVNSSTSTGTNEGQTRGQTEGIHKRPLLTPDEIGMLFSRQDDKASPAYPGLALALLTGRQPIILRRTNYDEDELFVGLFDPHPDHPFIPFQPVKTISAAPKQENKDRDMHAGLVDYYGHEQVEQAFRIFRKFGYEKPDAPIIKDGPVAFAKILLDRAQFNARMMQAFNDNTTTQQYLNWAEKNPADLVSLVGNLKSLDHFWYGSPRARKGAELIVKRKLHTINPVEAIQLYFIEVSAALARLIFYPLIIVCVEYWIRTALYVGKYRIDIGGANRIPLIASMLSAIIVYFIFLKLSKSVWVSLIAVIVYNLLNYFIFNIFPIA